MRVLIVGAGPVGLWIGANLIRAGHAVGLVGRRRVVQVLAEQGLRVQGAEGEWALDPPPAFESVAAAVAFGPADLICITTKAYDLPDALDELDDSGVIAGAPATLVASFQNGVGAEAAISARYGAGRVIAATTTTPVSLTDAGRLQVDRAGGGIAWAPVEASAAASDDCLDALTRSGCGARLADGRSLKWSKLLLNLSGNASGAILDLPPAQLFADARLFRFEMAMLREAVRVMDAEGIRAVSLPGGPAASLALALRLLPDAALRLILRRRLSAARGDKRPSLYFELAKRTGRSESPWLNGAVVAAGIERGVPTPVNARLASVMDDLVAGRADWGAWRGKADRLVAGILG